MAAVPSASAPWTCEACAASCPEACDAAWSTQNVSHTTAAAGATDSAVTTSADTNSLEPMCPVWRPCPGGANCGRDDLPTVAARRGCTEPTVLSEPVRYHKAPWWPSTTQEHPTPVTTKAPRRNYDFLRFRLDRFSESGCAIRRTMDVARQSLAPRPESAARLRSPRTGRLERPKMPEVTSLYGSYPLDGTHNRRPGSHHTKPTAGRDRQLLASV